MQILKFRKIKTCVGYKCDVCKKEMDTTPIYVEFSCGHGLDGSAFDFCSNKCVIKFFNKIKKGEK